MTVEQDLNNAVTALQGAAGSLNTTVTGLVGQKANLETLVGQSATNVTDSTTQADRAETALTSALAARDAAQTAEANANAIADSDITSALLSYGITNVADVHVYDTSKDSDGGAWRDRATWQGWYSEARPSGAWLGSHADVAAAVAAPGAIGDYYWDVGAQQLREITATGTPAAKTIYRGSKAKFPATVIIVKKPGSSGIPVSILIDADDPSLPVWMIYVGGFTQMIGIINGALSVAARNGVMVTGATDFDLHITSFLLDKSGRYGTATIGGDYLGTIAERNDGKNFGADDRDLLPSRVINAVALYVDPLAPIDPQTGLPRPVIACATAGGVSVILEDGTVRSSVSTAAWSSLCFGPSGDLFMQTVNIIDLVQASQWRQATFNAASGGFRLDDPTVALGSGRALSAGSKVVSAVANAGGKPGLGIYTPISRKSRSLIAHLHSDYAVPPRSFTETALALSSTDTADLVGATPLDDDFTGYADQAAAEAAGYSVTSAAITFDAANDQWDFNNTVVGGVSITKPTVVGATYEISAVLDARTAGFAYLRVDGTNLVSATTVGTIKSTFVATSTSTILTLWGSDIFAGSIGGPFRVRRIEPDRSGKNNGPIAYGTLTRAPVAAGAKLTALKGFTTEGNNLDVSHVAALGWGTGDFSYTFLAEVTDGVDNYFVEQWTASTANQIAVLKNSGNKIYTLVRDGGVNSEGASTVEARTGFHAVSLVRRSGVIETWLDGRIIFSAAAGQDIAAPTQAKLGARVTGSGLGVTGLAHASIAAYAPTAEQIKEQHRVLAEWHKPDADPTLLSDTVDALGYDEDTDLLYVSGPAGTTVLHGSTLTRDTTLTSTDAHLTSSDHNAVAGGSGIFALASANEVRFSLPALALRDRLLRRASLMGMRGTDAVQTAATTDATPTVIAAGSIQPGETRTYLVSVAAQEAGDPAVGSEHLLASFDFSVRRPINGNVEILGTPTIKTTDKTTGTMAVSLAADTTNQLWEISGTGVAATDLVWVTEVRVVGRS